MEDDVFHHKYNGEWYTVNFEVTEGSIEIDLVGRTDKRGVEYFVEYDKIPKQVLEALEQFVNNHFEVFEVA